ncbi:uncharacterized protein LOC142818109 [Rhipicephalus microplus]|uniref:uncharacterized protein LOC142818109 n=1 Tax=Rhipicephalus microplus TaxID=6941 RepID=UPI003F6A9876
MEFYSTDVGCKKLHNSSATSQFTRRMNSLFGCLNSRRQEHVATLKENLMWLDSCCKYLDELPKQRSCFESKPTCEALRITLVMHQHHFSCSKPAFIWFSLRAGWKVQAGFIRECPPLTTWYNYLKERQWLDMGHSSCSSSRTPSTEQKHSYIMPTLWHSYYIMSYGS